jgi:hypothetical protein
VIAQERSPTLTVAGRPYGSKVPLDGSLRDMDVQL